MGNLVRQTQFVFETLNNGRVSRQLRADHLQRDQTIELAIFSLVDRAHTALTEDLQYLVALCENGAGLQNRLADAEALRLGRAGQSWKGTL
jgi:hypothetical protein